MLYISLYFANRCREFFMPEEGTWNDSLTIPQEASGLSRDIVMPIRALEGECFLSTPEGLTWEHNGEREVRLVDGQTLRLTADGLGIGIMAFSMGAQTMVMPKYHLPIGATVTLGRGPECLISQDSSILSNSHGDLQAVNERECVYTDHSRNGTFINGIKLLGQRATLSYGDVITAGFGLKIVYLGSLVAINCPPKMRHNKLRRADPLPDFGLDLKKLQSADKASAVVWYHRSPRMLTPVNDEPVTIEPPLQKDTNNMPPAWMTIGPSATMVVPMLLSAMVGGRSNIAPMLAMMGGAAAMAVMWGVINARYRKRHGEEVEQKRLKVYADYITETENELLSLTERELSRLNTQNLTVEQCLALPTSSTHRLWERTPQHADFTVLRLGTGRVALPNAIETQKPKLELEPDKLRNEPQRLKDTYQYMNSAPITLKLNDWQLVGMLGSADRPVLMQSLVAQLAATHSYHDVLISVLAPESSRSQWEWARWLPHAYSNEDRSMRLTAFTPAAVEAVSEFISNLLMMREERLGESSAIQEEKAEQPLPHLVIFCADPALVENQAFVRRLIGKRLGVTMVILAQSVDQLPKECGVIIHAGERLGAVYTAQGDVTNVQFEVSELPALQRFSHQLAPLRVRDTAESSFIPTLVTFMEIYHARQIEDVDVWRFWNENHAWEGLKSTIGLRSGAQPFILDISEKAHGPHGLVAGTTGSGKSVMLQTYILSLALNYHPEEVQFILIDYKGGGMANVFTALPHVAGIIDNLQGPKTIGRALLSIQGEIKRREAVFKRLGVEKIDEYIRYYNRDPNEKPLAHLIIVVDEFAELKKEQPEFMHELVSTARVGRSVGIHMILATQKPSNSVDDEIWSNTKFRICLRVATRADSNDMLKRADAAYLRGMGRCYVQVGNDEIFEQVQTSFSGAEYNPTALIGSEEPRMLDDAGRPIILKKNSKKKRDRSEKPRTQMDVVLERINQVMQEHHVRPADKLWLQEVAPLVELDQVPGFASIRFDGENWKTWCDPAESLKVFYGIVDDVRMQRHDPLFFDFMAGHNLKIVAPAGMGKTTLVQTMAMSAALTYTPDQLNMYIFSLTSRTLGVLSGLPHVGEIVYDDETAEIIQLVNLLSDENRRRRELFAGRMTDSFAQYNQAAAASGGEFRPLPAILVFVDRFKQLKDKMDEDRLRVLYDMVQNASSRGIYFVVTAISLASDELGKVGDLFAGVAIQQEGRSEYREVLAATAPISVEEASVNPGPGRGLVWYDNGVHGPAACEMQCAFYGSSMDTERVEKVSAAAARLRAAWKGHTPRGIVRIPEHMTLADFHAVLDQLETEHKPGQVLIGLSRETGGPCAISLDDTPSFLISGGMRTGRTNTVLCLAEEVALTGGAAHLFGEDSRLRRLAGRNPGVTFHALDDKEGLNTFFTQELAGEMKRRKELLTAAQDDEAARARITASLQPIALIFDDYENFATAVQGHGLTFITDWMRQMNAHLPGRRLFFILGMSQYAANHSVTNQFVQAVAKGGSGIALCGSLTDGNPWGAGNISLNKLKLPLGEGWQIVNGQLRRVVLPEWK